MQEVKYKYMSCKYFRKRSKKYMFYFYCAYQRKQIEIKECSHCQFKEYKLIKKIKGKKHKRTMKTDIPQSVKRIVWERDYHQCIFCHTPVPLKYANAHFIPRSAGGLGIPENIFTACDLCHHEQDNGKETAKYDKLAKEYLKKYYGSEWKKEKLIYKKYERGEQIG